MATEHTPAQKLEVLNSFRAKEGKPPFADWRQTRHMPMLDAYREAQIARQDADFEASEAELAAQAGRPIHTADADISTEDGPMPADFVKPSTTEEAPAVPAKMKSYKQVANYNKSSKESPVKFIHEFLSANPTLSRKAAVIALTADHGINYSTARTQYQRWFTANKAAK